MHQGGAAAEAALEAAAAAVGGFAVGEVRGFWEGQVGLGLQLHLVGLQTCSALVRLLLFWNAEPKALVCCGIRVPCCAGASNGTGAASFSGGWQMRSALASLLLSLSLCCAMLCRVIFHCAVVLCIGGLSSGTGAAYVSVAAGRCASFRDCC